MLRGRRLLLSIIGIVILAAAAFAASPLLPKYFPNLIVESRDVRFASRDATLAATLFVPRLRKITAAVVLVHGSGQEPRMSWLAWPMAREGIAVLTYDKRGVGESTGTYAGPEVHTENVSPENLALLTDDAASAVRELIHQLQPRTMPVGLVGGSQAAWIIPPAAEKEQDVQFIVLWSGPVVTTHEQRIFQNITREDPDFWKAHTQAQVDDMMEKSADHFTFGDTDPRDVLRRLTIPGLWIFGGQDSSVPVELSINRLSSLDSEKKSHFEYRVFPSYGHNLVNRDIFIYTLDWIRKTAAVGSQR